MPCNQIKTKRTKKVKIEMFREIRTNPFIVHAHNFIVHKYMSKQR